MQEGCLPKEVRLIPVLRWLFLGSPHAQALRNG